MKTGITVIMLFFSLCFLHAQNPQTINVKSGSYDREYLLYLPKSYIPGKPMGLIVCLHGFNRSMEDFFDKYPIAPVADSLNLIVLAPQALPEQDPQVKDKAAILASLRVDIPLDAAWSCGLQVTATILGAQILDVELNAPVDDVAFISQIINTTMANYNIESANRFIFGTSMGGFMSYQYAMFYANDLAGLVSVCGSMGRDIKVPETLAITKVPVCDFHSLTDEVVPYGGSITYQTALGKAVVLLNQPKPDVIQLWVAKNHANFDDPKVEDVNYYPSSNSIKVKKYTYPNSDGINEVIHYQADGANHNYYFSKANGDCMDYNEEIIKFLSKHMKKNNTGILAPYADNLKIYPNPVADRCVIQGTQEMAKGERQMTNEIRLYNVSGVLSGVYQAQPGQTEIDLSGYAKGIYFLKYGNKTVKVIKK